MDEYPLYKELKFKKINPAYKIYTEIPSNNEICRMQVGTQVITYVRGKSFLESGMLYPNKSRKDIKCLD